MNTAYFDSTVNNLNAITSDLTQYEAYVNQALAVQNMSCAQLAEFAVETVAKLTGTTAQIAAISAKATAEISTIQANVTSALAALAPLLTPPTNLSSVITWITTLINTYAGPNAALLAQETVLAAQLVRITTAVTDCTTAVATIAASIASAISSQQISKGCAL